MKINRFSKSFFSTWQGCPAHAALDQEYGHGIGKGSEALMKGNLFHYLIPLVLTCLPLMDAMEISGDDDVNNWLAWAVGEEGK